MACNPRPPRLSRSGSQPSATRFLPCPRKQRGQEGQPTKMFNSPAAIGGAIGRELDRLLRLTARRMILVASPRGGFWALPLDREPRLPSAAHRAADCELSRVWHTDGWFGGRRYVQRHYRAASGKGEVMKISHLSRASAAFGIAILLFGDPANRPAGPAGRAWKKYLYA